MAGDRRDYPGFPFMFPFFPFPLVPPELWLQMWVQALEPYREFLEWYKQVVAEWNREDVDASLRHLGNELLWASLGTLKTSREIREKLAKIQTESIEHYLNILDRLGGAGGHRRA